MNWCSAQAAGIDSLLIVGGIHGDDVGLEHVAGDVGDGWVWDTRALDQLCAKHDVRPKYVMGSLKW